MSAIVQLIVLLLQAIPALINFIKTMVNLFKRDPKAA